MREFEPSHMSDSGKNEEDTNKRALRVVCNADNHLVMPLLGTFGHVDEVNGHGAEEIPVFVPTRAELIQIAKYWALRKLEIEWDWFRFEDVGSSDMRLHCFAGCRLNRIAASVGEDAVYEVVDDVRREYGSGLDKDQWNTFLRGKDLSVSTNVKERPPLSTHAKERIQAITLYAESYDEYVEKLAEVLREEGVQLASDCNQKGDSRMDQGDGSSASGESEKVDDDDDSMPF